MASSQLDMRGEFARLATFNGFVAPDGVWNLQLARAGFCRTSDCGDFEVICFSCGLKLDVRTLPRQPVSEVHGRLAPLCSFVTGTSNNQPVDPNNSGTFSSVLTQNFSSFAPSQITGDSQLPSVSTLSQSLPLTLGFVGGMELVSIPESEVSNLDPSVLLSPDELEPSVLPSLPSDFLTSLQNATIDPASSAVMSAETAAFPGQSESALGLEGPPEVLATDGEQLPMEGTYSVEYQQHEAQEFSNTAKPDNTPQPTEKKTVTFEDLGIVVQRPKRQDFATIPQRLATFGSWKGLGKFQTKEVLAEAGFYYAGYADCCRCFYCGGGLKNWEPEDHPWIEHGRWFKNCPYVLTNQGVEFISAVESLNRTNTKIQLSDVKQEMVRMKKTTNGTEANHPMRREDSTMEITSEDFQDEGYQDDLSLAERLKTENDELKQQTTCKICLDRDVSILYVPCGHLVTCSLCAPSVQKCPVCRQRIKGLVKVHPE